MFFGNDPRETGDMKGNYGWMDNMNVRLGADTDNKIVWLDPDRNAIKLRVYDASAWYYSDNVTFHAPEWMHLPSLKGTLDARANHGTLEADLVIFQKELHAGTRKGTGPKFSVENAGI